MPPCVFTQAQCHINLAAIQRNFKRCGDPHDLMPVLKADAYGHGLLEVADCLSKAGAERFAIGCADEGRALREAGFRQTIMPLMAPITDHDWDMIVSCDLTPLICSFAELERALQEGSVKQPLPIALKLETGMHRQGFREEELEELVARLRAAHSVEPMLAVSHCSCADIPARSAWTETQVATFSRMTGYLREHFPAIRGSLFNSAGNIHKEPACACNDITRPGIILYGGNPFVNTSLAHLGEGFEWAMSFSTSILQVTRLRKGESVSYGQLFKADHDMLLAVAGSGYANALPRAITYRLEALVHGRRVHSTGRVCMNMVMFDVTDVPGVKAGDTLWFWGGSPAEGESSLTPQDWADRLETICYEPLCLVGGMNPRVYHYDGQPCTE